MTEIDFLGRLHESGAGVYEQAIGLLWWAGRTDPTAGLSAKEICTSLEATGLPRQNVSRLNAKLTSDRRTSKVGTAGAWRLHPRTRTELNDTFSQLIGSKQAADTGSVLPTALVAARGYLAKVAHQLNASYDAHLYDCCAVMCRRILETLLIEVYEHASRSNEIKAQDGQFLMLNGLISYFEQDQSFTPGRGALQGLRDFKRLGDLSAHNRRFNARREDIDRVRDGLRVAVEELAHLAGLKP
jgi:hypothetical protein